MTFQAQMLDDLYRAMVRPVVQDIINEEKKVSKGIHRVTPTSEAGSRMISTGKPHDPLSIPKEIREWNAQVEAEKAAKQKGK